MTGIAQIAVRQVLGAAVLVRKRSCQVDDVPSARGDFTFNFATGDLSLALARRACPSLESDLHTVSEPRRDADRISRAQKES